MSKETGASVRKLASEARAGTITSEVKLVTPQQAKAWLRGHEADLRMHGLGRRVAAEHWG